MDSTASANELPPGYSFHGYRIDRILGTGSSGVTYLATDTDLDLQVVIEEYFPSDIANRDRKRQACPVTEEHGDTYRSGLTRFARMGITLARLNQPNIVQIMSVFNENNTAYMVMRFEEGVALRSYLLKRDHAEERSEHDSCKNAHESILSI